VDIEDCFDVAKREVELHALLSKILQSKLLHFERMDAIAIHSDLKNSGSGGNVYQLIFMALRMRPPLRARRTTKVPRRSGR
jgi:hypothetical protein